MWNLSYMENGEIKVKRFKSDKEADNWVNSKNDDADFVPFKMAKPEIPLALDNG